MATAPRAASILTPTALTLGQAAARLGVDVHTVRRWVRAEQAPTVRVGCATRIPKSFIDGLLAAGWSAWGPWSS